MSLHDKIVKQVLPKFAKELQKEGIISSFTRKRFKVKIQEAFPNTSFPPFAIDPDLLLILPDEKRFLVEIVNPKDAKRLMGEIACAQFLRFHNLIDAALIFLLPCSPEAVTAPNKGAKIFQGGQFMNELFPYNTLTWIASWSTIDEYSLSNLKSWILSRQESWWYK